MPFALFPTFRPFFLSLSQPHQAQDSVGVFLQISKKSNSRCRVQGRSERPQREEQPKNHLGLVPGRPGPLGDASGAAEIGVVEAGACAVEDVKREGSRRRRRRHRWFLLFPSLLLEKPADDGFLVSRPLLASSLSFSLSFPVDLFLSRGRESQLERLRFFSQLSLSLLSEMF